MIGEGLLDCLNVFQGTPAAGNSFIQTVLKLLVVALDVLRKRFDDELQGIAFD